MYDHLKKRLDVGIGEFLVFVLIILEIIEFAGLLPADIDYVKKIISWVCMGYLFYNANLTEIIFGYKDKIIDLLLIASYFMLVMKDFIFYSKTALEEISKTGASFLVPLYSFILDNAFHFEAITFYIGGGIILLLALLNVFVNVEIKAPSIMSMAFRPGTPRSIWEKILIASTSFIVYTAFFVIVFNLTMEWLAWAVDSMLVILAIFFYLFFFVKHFKKLNPGSLLYKIGDVGEDFYARFINLFHSRETVLLGISGLLVLHLLTDVSNFIVPYILGKNISYFVALGAGHDVIPSLLSIDLAIAKTAAIRISVVLVYLYNIAAMLLLFLGPSFIWYEMYTKNKMELPKAVYGLFYASLFAFAVSPVFRIQRIGIGDFYGVDILTNTINVSNSMLIMSIAVFITLSFSILCINHSIRNFLKYLSIFLVELFFAYYIYLFFRDITGFYAKSFVFINNPFLLFYIFIFMVTTLFFYIGGMLYFIYLTAVDATKRFI